LQQVLLGNPESGSVIPGCGGLRKMRWPDPRRSKGKRGGLRIIYLYVPETQVILFVKVYDKDESDDLTTDQRKVLTRIAGDVREAALLRN
jgi:hypothetical protein